MAKTSRAKFKHQQDEIMHAMSSRKRLYDSTGYALKDPDGDVQFFSQSREALVKFYAAKSEIINLGADNVDVIETLLEDDGWEIVEATLLVIEKSRQIKKLAGQKYEIVEW